MGDYKAYTYYLYHVPTGKKYYGVRWANKCSPEEDLWTVYFGSSKKVDQLIENTGKDSFLAEVRKTFDTAVEALVWEQKVIDRIKAVKRDDWLNQSNSLGPFYRQGIRGPMREETKQKIRISRKLKNYGSNKTSFKIGRTPYNKGTKRSLELIEKGVATRKKNGIKTWNIGIPRNEQEKINISIGLKEKYKKDGHHMVGRSLDEDTKNKIRITQTGKRYVRTPEQKKNYSEAKKRQWAKKRAAENV